MRSCRIVSFLLPFILKDPGIWLFTDNCTYNIRSILKELEIDFLVCTMQHHTAHVSCDSRGTHHLQTQLQDGSRLIFSSSFSYISFSSSTFPLYISFYIFSGLLAFLISIIGIEQQQHLHQDLTWQVESLANIMAG